MKINITVDLDDFTGNWSGAGLNELVQEEIKNEALKAVKKSPEYKALIKKKTQETLEKIGL
jgi:hypothetical protein